MYILCVKSSISSWRLCFISYCIRIQQVRIVQHVCATCKCEHDVQKKSHNVSAVWPLPVQPHQDVWLWWNGVVLSRDMAVNGSSHEETSKKMVRCNCKKNHIGNETLEIKRKWRRRCLICKRDLHYDNMLTTIACQMMSCFMYLIYVSLCWV